MDSINKNDSLESILSKQDLETLNKIKQTVRFKTMLRLDEIRSTKDKNNTYDFSKLDHVQINYFNITALKPHKIPERPTALNWGDAVIADPDTNQLYLCVIVYFDKDHLTADKFQALLEMTSRKHNWVYSDQDKLYIDTCGVYVDKVEINKASIEGEKAYDK